MKSTYIIGEIGQNHNGSVDIAMLIVDLVSRPVHEETFRLELRPMDAIKLQKRDLKQELTQSELVKFTERNIRTLQELLPQFDTKEKKDQK